MMEKFFEYKKKNGKTVKLELVGLSHSFIGGYPPTVKKEPLRNLAETGVVYPSLTKKIKESDIVCHEHNLVRCRIMPKLDKPYYDVDMHADDSRVQSRGELMDLRAGSHLSDLNKGFGALLASAINQKEPDFESMDELRKSTTPAVSFFAEARSAFMAETIARLAEKVRDGGKVTVVVGGAHLSHLVNFLDNPSERTDLINRFKTTFKKSMKKLDELPESDEKHMPLFSFLAAEIHKVVELSENAGVHFKFQPLDEVVLEIGGLRNVSNQSVQEYLKREIKKLEEAKK